MLTDGRPQGANPTIHGVYSRVSPLWASVRVFLSLTFLLSAFFQQVAIEYSANLVMLLFERCKGYLFQDTLQENIYVYV